MSSVGTALLHQARGADGPRACAAQGQSPGAIWSLSSSSSSRSRIGSEATSSTCSSATAVARRLADLEASVRVPRLSAAGRGPLLIAVDGPRASGKTTLAHRLARTLAIEHGLDVVVEAGVAPDDARRPSSPRLRALAATVGDDEEAHRAQQSLAALNRVELLDALRVQLQREGPRAAPDVILLDGYTFSGMVDAHRHDCVRAVRRVQEAFCPAPALTLLLRVSPLTLAARHAPPRPALPDLMFETRLYDALARAYATRDVGAVGFVQPLNGAHPAARVCEMARRIVARVLQEDDRDAPHHRLTSALL